MKKKSIRTSLFTLLVIASFASHTYLNSLSVPTTNIDSKLKMEQVDVEDLANKQDATLPDVKIVKHVVLFLKKMLPISQ